MILTKNFTYRIQTTTLKLHTSVFTPFMFFMHKQHPYACILTLMLFTVITNCITPVV